MTHVNGTSPKPCRITGQATSLAYYRSLKTEDLSSGTIVGLNACVKDVLVEFSAHTTCHLLFAFSIALLWVDQYKELSGEA